MIKTLLGTSALAGLVFFVGLSGPAGAETLTSGAVPPSLKIDGFTAINSYFANQQRRENGRGGPQPHLAVDASNLFFTILGTSTSGLEYMYRVSIETIPGTDNVIDQNYAQLKASFGTIQGGCVVGPEDTMIYDASTFMGGTGVFDGGYNNIYNMSAGVARGNDIIGDTGAATKIVYYSPELMGWQVGVAYTPSTAQVGSNKLDNQRASGAPSRIPGNRGLYEFSGSQPFDLRSVALGVTYRKEMGKWSITLSGAGITAKSYLATFNLGRVAVQNAKSYQLGFILGYGDLRLGGGYLNSGKSHLPLVTDFTYNTSSSNSLNLTSMSNGDAGYAWNVGAGYTIGAYQLGASYQRTNRNTGNYLKAHSDFYSATVDVTPLQGLKVYTEIDYIRSRTNSVVMARTNAFATAASKPSSAIGNNAGLLGIIGTKLSF